MQLGLKGIKLTNFDIDYGDDNTRTFAKVLFKELSTRVNKLDLENNAYDVDNVFLSGANINANLYLPANNANPKNDESKDPKTSEQQKALSLLLGKLVLNDVKVAYNNTAIAPTRQGMDFNHLNFQSLMWR